MQDLGYIRNAAYGVKVKNLPDGKKRVKDKVPSDWNNSGSSMNKCFYRFGSKTNIRQ